MFTLQYRYVDITFLTLGCIHQFRPEVYKIFISPFHSQRSIIGPRDIDYKKVLFPSRPCDFNKPGEDKGGHVQVTTRGEILLHNTLHVDIFRQVDPVLPTSTLMNDNRVFYRCALRTVSKVLVYTRQISTSSKGESSKSNHLWLHVRVTCV